MKIELENILGHISTLKKKLIAKIDKDWEWDFGISFTDAKKKFKANKVVIGINNFLLGLFIAISSIGTGGILSLLFLAHPVCMSILLVFDLMAVVLTYYEYNGLLEGVKECITDIIKNARLKKIKH